MALPSLEQTPFSLTETDRQVLAQTDDEFVLHDWEDLKNIIGTDVISHLSPKNLQLSSPSPHVFTPQSITITVNIWIWISSNICFSRKQRAMTSGL